MNDLLRSLTLAAGISGDEYDVRSLIRDKIVDLVDDWQVDGLGNIIALKKGSGASDLRVMLDAHMDEVGLIVTGIDSNGMLKFDTIGGLSAMTLASQVVEVGRKKIRGVIGGPPIHLSGTSRNKIPNMSSLRIDIGAKDKNSASSKAKIGDRVTFLSDYIEVGDDDDFGRSAIGKAFDNRAACAALIELLQGEPYPFDLYCCFTVQEEVGLRGAKVAAYTVKPDAAIVMECTPAFDLPNDLDRGSNTALGQGPALYIMDSQTIQDPRLVRHIMQSADNAAIPYQVRRPGGGGTNTGNVQRADIGCSAATIGLPGRHAHTGNMVINLKDYANYVKLADAALRALNRAVIARK